MSFLQSVVAGIEFAKEISLHPKTATREHATSKELVMFAALMLFFYSVGSGLLAMLMASLTGNEILLAFAGISGYAESLAGGGLLLLIPINFFSGIIGLFIGTAVLHGFNKLLRIYKKPLENTFAAYTYSLGPMGLFGWIPLVNIAVGIWSLIVSVYAISNQQEISFGKALISLFIPVIIIFGALAVFLIPTIFL